MNLPKLYLNQRVKALWVRALRSGQYIQVRGQLCKGKNERCCLGVLAEVYMADNNDGGCFVNNGLHFMTDDYNTVSDAFGDYLPDVVKDWVGITDRGVLGRLAAMNDEGVAFSEIARRIEAASSPYYI